VALPDIPKRVNSLVETEFDRALGGAITSRSLRPALGSQCATEPRPVLLLAVRFCSEDGCTCSFQQLCRVKISGPQFRNKTENSRVVSKANFQKGISRFESCRPSSQLRSRYIGAKSARESPHVGRFFDVTESPARQKSTGNSKILPKVSPRYLENSRFAERGGGDWFDLELRAGLASHERKNFGGPFSRVKRTCRFAPHMSTFDPQSGHC
jgi:hypothetical protein